MVEVAIEETVGWAEPSPLTISSEPKIGLANFNQSEMALFLECRPKCAPTTLTTADIVRDADLSTTADLKHPQLFSSHRLALASRITCEAP